MPLAKGARKVPRAFNWCCDDPFRCGIWETPFGLLASAALRRRLSPVSGRCSHRIDPHVEVPPPRRPPTCPAAPSEGRGRAAASPSTAVQTAVRRAGVRTMPKRWRPAGPVATPGAGRRGGLLARPRGDAAFARGFPGDAVARTIADLGDQTVGRVNVAERSAIEADARNGEIRAPGDADAARKVVRVPRRSGALAGRLAWSRGGGRGRRRA